MPWMFAYDRLNFATYLPVYYNQMLKLPMEYPEECEHLKSGGMSVQLGTTTTFGQFLLIKQVRKQQTRYIDSRGHEKIQFESWNGRQI